MFRAALHNKIGNLLAYLAHEIPNLVLTKALKLLYLIDESAVRETGMPVTWLDHKVWKLGPVAVEVYRELRHNEKTTVGNRTFSLTDFIVLRMIDSPKHEKQTDVYIDPKPGVKIDLAEFSEYEEKLVERIVAKYRNTPARDLVRLLHEENTLWHQKVVKMELDRAFENGSTSRVSIDFDELIKDDEVKMLASQAAYESLEFETAFEI